MSASAFALHIFAFHRWTWTPLADVKAVWQYEQTLSLVVAVVACRWGVDNTWATCSMASSEGSGRLNEFISRTNAVCFEALFLTKETVCSWSLNCSTLVCTSSSANFLFKGAILTLTMSGSLSLSETMIVRFVKVATLLFSPSLSLSKVMI